MIRFEPFFILLLTHICAQFEQFSKAELYKMLAKNLVKNDQEACNRYDENKWFYASKKIFMEKNILLQVKSINQYLLSYFSS